MKFTLPTSYYVDCGEYGTRLLDDIIAKLLEEGSDIKDRIHCNGRRTSNVHYDDDKCEYPDVSDIDYLCAECSQNDYENGLLDGRCKCPSTDDEINDDYNVIVDRRDGSFYFVCDFCNSHNQFDELSYNLYKEDFRIEYFEERFPGNGIDWNEVKNKDLVATVSAVERNRAFL